MDYSDGPESPAPTVPVPAPSPSDTAHSEPDIAAVAATVSVVGVLLAAVLTWLVIRLRRASNSQSSSIPISRRPTSYVFRPSFAPSEASSKFGFVRKPLHLSHRQGQGSWDFADPDPFAPSKESSLDAPLPAAPSPKHRPAPLPLPTPAYTPRLHRTSTHKDDLIPRTPTTPDCIDSPPPAYCRDGAWPPFHPPKGLLSPS